MKYRGFNITACPDSGIERYNYRTHSTDFCNGYYCQVYPISDDVFASQLDDFCLAAGHEIPDTSDVSLNDGIIGYVNEHHSELKAAKDDVCRQHKEELIGRLVCWLGETESGEELYDTLINHIGMSDMDILESGYKFLVPFFNREYYAETIADYIYETGTEETTTGNWIIPFSEIGEKFAVDLNEDTELLKMICDKLDDGFSYPVADLNTENQEFNAMFYTAYCPKVDEDVQEMEMT